MEIRKELESNVIAVNHHLRDSVQYMDYIELLRNLHPLYRSDYAYKLLRQKLITRDEASEFIKFVGHVAN